jgi:hypothetical protein
MKQTKRGGLDPFTTKLNIWACTIGGGILGYTQFLADLQQLMEL